MRYLVHGFSWGTPSLCSRVFARDCVVLKEMCRMPAVMVKLSTWRGFKIGIKLVRHAFGYVCWCFWGANRREKTHLNVSSTMLWGSRTKGRKGQPNVAFSLPQLPGSHKVNGSTLSHCPAAMMFGPSVHLWNSEPKSVLPTLSCFCQEVQALTVVT